MDEKPQESLEERLLLIERMAAKDLPTRIANCNRHSSTERDLLSKEPELLADNRRHMMDLLHFVQVCKVVIGKPKVLRVRGSSARSAFVHKNRFVMPQVYLVSGDKKLFIESIEDVKDWNDKTDKHGRPTREPRMPWIYMRWGHISMGQQYSSHTTYYQSEDLIAPAFVRSAGDNWQTVVAAVRAEWERVGASLDALVAAQFDAKGDRERKEFQSKLMDMLAKTRGLIDAPPEAVFEIFKLGYEEIEKLARFAARNKADIALVQLEDVVEAQNFIRVRKIMES